LTGSFPLISRTGQVAGGYAEVEVRFQLEWKTPNPRSLATAASAAGSVGSSKSRLAARPGSAIAGGGANSVMSGGGSGRESGDRGSRLSRKPSAPVAAPTSAVSRSRAQSPAVTGSRAPTRATKGAPLMLSVVFGYMRSAV
jgi:hypothetical protein